MLFVETCLDKAICTRFCWQWH